MVKETTPIPPMSEYPDGFGEELACLGEIAEPVVLNNTQKLIVRLAQRQLLEGCLISGLGRHACLQWPGSHLSCSCTRTSYQIDQYSAGLWSQTSRITRDVDEALDTIARLM